MLPQVVPGMSQFTPQSLDRLANDERRSLADAASLGCTVNMWVIGRLELVSVPGVAPLSLRAPLSIEDFPLIVCVAEPRWFASSHVL